MTRIQGCIIGEWDEAHRSDIVSNSLNYYFKSFERKRSRKEETHNNIIPIVVFICIYKKEREKKGNDFRVRVFVSLILFPLMAFSTYSTSFIAFSYWRALRIRMFEDNIRMEWLFMISYLFRKDFFKCCLCLAIITWIFLRSRRRTWGRSCITFGRILLSLRSTAKFQRQRERRLINGRWIMTWRRQVIQRFGWLASRIR